MSLVSEALRKARREAAQRKRPSRLPAALPAPPGGGRGTRFGAGLLLGALIAIAAALLGAAATWWLVTTLGGEPAVNASVPTPVVAEDEPTGAPASSPAAAPAAQAVPLPLRPAPTPAHEPPAADPEVAVEPATPAAGDAPPTPRPSPRAASPRVEGGEGPPPGAADGGGERVYVLEADLGYASLSLGFVVARPDDPFAEVNGREVHVGTEVDGFVVEEITPRGVRLRDARGPLELRLR